MRKFFLYSFLLFTVHGAWAQRLTPEQYISQYKEIAISEMKRMGIPAAITLAQGILESESGNSDLVQRSNNHFGIKCKNTWTGAVVYHDDDASGECFRSYKSAEESYRDHSNFLRGGSRYASLFNLDASDYKAWAFGLKKAGYATNPQYPAILIKNIEQYNLQQYTLAGIKDMPVYNAGAFDIKGADTIKIQMDVAVEAKDSSTSESILDIPLKVITINQRKCVLAKKGTSFLLIATRNNINLEKLLEYNELAEDGILGKTQYVFLEKKSKTGEMDEYIVQPGQTVYDISQLNGIQLGSLMDYNKLSDGQKLEPGTRLSLRPVKKARPADGKSGKIRYHQVGANEGLYSIAKKYKVTVQQLREWNGLENDELKSGQKLIVAK